MNRAASHCDSEMEMGMVVERGPPGSRSNPLSGRPVIILFVLAQKFIVRGLQFGAVKG